LGSGAVKDITKAENLKTSDIVSLNLLIQSLYFKSFENEVEFEKIRLMGCR